MIAAMNSPPPTSGLPQNLAARAIAGFRTIAATSHAGSPRMSSGAMICVSRRCCTMCMLKR